MSYNAEEHCGKLIFITILVKLLWSYISWKYFWKWFSYYNLPKYQIYCGKTLLERLHYRAIRTILGVSLTTPIPAITGDMEWNPIHHRIQVNIVRLYCRLVKIPETRICRKIFLWDQNMSTRYRDTWFNHAKTLFD